MKKSRLNDRAFNEVVEDFMKKVTELKYTDKEKRLVQMELMINLPFFLEGQDQYRENCNVLKKIQEHKEKTKVKKIG